MGTREAVGDGRGVLLGRGVEVESGVRVGVAVRVGVGVRVDVLVGAGVGGAPSTVKVPDFLKSMPLKI